MTSPLQTGDSWRVMCGTRPKSISGVIFGSVKALQSHSLNYMNNTLYTNTALLQRLRAQKPFTQRRLPLFLQHSYKISLSKNIYSPSIAFKLFKDRSSVVEPETYHQLQTQLASGFFSLATFCCQYDFFRHIHSSFSGRGRVCLNIF
jgi:hypothetical protein